MKKIRRTRIEISTQEVLVMQYRAPGSGEELDPSLEVCPLCHSRLNHAGSAGSGAAIDQGPHHGCRQLDNHLYQEGEGK